MYERIFMQKKIRKTLVAFTGFIFVLGLASCGDNSSSAGTTSASYTYNTYLTTKPKTWNVHNWSSSDESYINSFTEMGLYDTILNDTKDGYKFVTEMASAFPVDVTKDISDEEFDQYGYNSNIDSGYVWDISLNENAVWQDGTAITADTYIDSLERQLDSDYSNFRADSFYASNLVVANAESYYKQGRETVEAAYDLLDESTGKFEDEVNVGYDGKYFINVARATPYAKGIFSNGDDETSLYTVINNRSSAASDAVELAGERIMDASRYYLWKYVDHSESQYLSDWNEVTQLSDIKEDMLKESPDIELDEFSSNEVLVRTEKGNSSTTDGTREAYSASALQEDLYTFVNGIGSGKGMTGKTWAWELPLFVTVYNDNEVDWDNVGIRKIDDYKFRFYLSQQISSLNLKFSLNSNWIVKTDLYDDLTTILPDSDSKATSYATNSVDNYMSYGPYKLTKYEFGKSFTMEKNDKWYGYTDGNHIGQYQMTAINTQIITDHNTVRQSFELGELDDFTMDKNDMSTYGNSSRKTTTYESYTQKISFNSDYESLKKRQTTGQNKTILSNKNFRKGLSLAMDRDSFASSTTAGSKGFTGLLNDLYLANVNNGEMYRNTTQGESVYESVYGDLGGDPNAAGYTTSSLDEAETGYNYAQAKYYVAKGIEEEISSTKDGHLASNDKIDIDIRVYDNTSDATISMVSFLRSAFTQVISDASASVAGSNLSLNLSATKDEDYYTTAKTGGYDLIFSTWGGAAINPYGLMQVYCDSTFDSCCEYGFKGKQDQVTLDIDSDGDGSVETKSYNAWYTKMNNDLIEPEIDESIDTESADYKAWSKIHEQKLNILAGLEAGILNRFEAVPLVARGTSSLNSYKVENATKNYISLVGYGGIRFLEFKFNDAEWAKFISDSNYSSDLYKN